MLAAVGHAVLAAVTPLPCDYLQLSTTLQTCIAVWAKGKLPFKMYLINVLRLKVIEEKNRFDFSFFQKNYLLLMLEVINVYEVVFIYVMYVMCLDFFVKRNVKQKA